MILDPQSVAPRDFYRLMIGAIIPRPIAFVSTVDADGRLNVAPFSYFAPLASKPPLLGVSINDRAGGPKDTLANARSEGELVVNIVNEPMLERMVMTSGEWAHDIDEFGVAGLTPVPSERVKPPRVGESPIQFECRLDREVSLGNTTLVIAEILLVHVADEVMRDGLVDPGLLHAVGRLGGDGYTIVREVVHAARPVVPRPPVDTAG